MNIVVCIKQVPAIDQVKFNPETKTLVREGVELRVNSLDRRAITQAIKLKEAFGGQVTIITMGPPQAKDILVEPLALGADRAIHLMDMAFAGSDTLATARVLAAAIKKLDFDVILCGRFSIDAETGQVGPEIAELLDIPQATNLRRLEVSQDGKTLIASREVDDGIVVLELPTPCLITAGEFLVQPLPRPAAEVMEEAGRRNIEVWNAADLGLPADQIGKAGSPTMVSEIREMEITREKHVIQGDDPEASAKHLRDYLVTRGLFTPWQRVTAKAAPGEQRGPGAVEKAIWVVAEHVRGRLRNVTLELLGRATELAAQNGGEVAAVLMGHNVQEHVATLAAYGADKVYLADDPRLANYDTERYTSVVTEAITLYRPFAVLMPATVDGRDLAPRIAARLRLGLTGDCIDIEIDSKGQLVQLKPAFGGTFVAPILSRTTPALATVRPGMLAKLAPQPARQAVVQKLTFGSLPQERAKFVRFEPVTGVSGIEMDDAETLIGVGAGVGSKENLTLLEELAGVLDGSLASSLRAVSTGIMPGQLQIGLTGRAVSPRFYVAVGVRGALNHTIGIQRAETVVAINNDPSADIFKVCDFGIVGDLTQVVPALTRVLRDAKTALLVGVRS